MTSAALFVRMVRWRVAVTLWSFLLIGAAAQGPLRPSVALLLAAVSLAASYVVATTVNDIADRDVDGSTIPETGRPLVAGTASERISGGRMRSRLPSPWRPRRSPAARSSPCPRPRCAIGYATRSGRSASYRTWLAPMSFGRVRDRPLCARAPGRRWTVDRSTSSSAGRSTRSSSRDQPQGLPRPSRRRRVRQAHAPARARQDGHLRGHRHRAVAGCVTLVAALDGSPAVIGIVCFFAAVILFTLWRLSRTSDLREEQIARSGSARRWATAARLHVDRAGPRGPRALPRACGSSRWRSSRS